MFENVQTDQLNNVLLNYFPNANKLEHENSYSEQPISLTNYVFKYLKHLRLAGVIFDKKLNKSRIKKLNYIYSDTGRIKHFPPAAQE